LIEQHLLKQIAEIDLRGYRTRADGTGHDDVAQQFCDELAINLGDAGCYQPVPKLILCVDAKAQQFG